jgi:adenylate cyclase
VAEFSRLDVAARAGVEVDFVEDLVRAGILAIDEEGSFTSGAARVARIIRGLQRSGLPLDAIATAVARGSLSFEVFASSPYDRISPLTGDTFREVSERDGIPLEVLLVVREAIGFAIADPEDRMREDEIELLPVLRSSLTAGVPASSVEHLLRVYGESARRMVEAESEVWESHVLGPLIGAGVPATEALTEAAGFGEAILGPLDDAILALHHGQQEHVWMVSIYQWVEDELERAGVRARVERPATMCFLDLAGYTQLTEERGDQAAAETARTLTSLVQHTAHEYRGRVVKWLGDGVMLYFDEPAQALRGSLEMLDRVRAAGLPPAHVGIDAGPVIIQDGDYFGRTVNVAARIAAYARPGQILASDQAVRSAGDRADGWRFEQLGPVELKGVSRPLILHRLTRR